MVGSTSIMAASAEGNQRLMMYALPVVFTPFIISFPAGLVIYWITTNVWTMGQQWVVKKVIPPPPKPTEDGAGGREAAPAPAAQEETRRALSANPLPSTTPDAGRASLCTLPAGWPAQ